MRILFGLIGAAVLAPAAVTAADTGLIAMGDVDGDGIAEVIMGAEAGAAASVKVVDARSGKLKKSFSPFPAAFTGGVRVAAGDLNGDGRDDIIVGAGPGGLPHVKVFDGVTGAETRGFLAYEPTYKGGVVVAAGDVNGDGYSDIATTANAGAGPHVKVFDGLTGEELGSFFGASGAGSTDTPPTRATVGVSSAPVKPKRAEPE